MVHAMLLSFITDGNAPGYHFQYYYYYRYWEEALVHSALDPPL